MNIDVALRSIIAPGPVVRTLHGIPPEALTLRLRENGFRIVAWSGSHLGDPMHGLMLAIIEQLQLVDAHAANWNAISSELQVLIRVDPRPIAIVMDHTGPAREFDPKWFDLALDILGREGAGWTSRGSLFRVVIVE